MIFTGLPEAAGGIVLLTTLAKVHSAPKRDLVDAENNLLEVLQNVELYGKHFEAKDQEFISQHYHRSIQCSVEYVS